MSRTKLQRHKQHGKTLHPPFTQVPNLKLGSWMHERLPQMLWAVVLLANLPRERALHVIRSVAMRIDALDEKAASGDVSMTGIVKMPTQERSALLETLVADESARAVLSSMLWFDNLPARDAWANAIRLSASGQAEEMLMRGIASSLWHQSQEVTDCRWARIICLSAAGRMQWPMEMAQEVRAIQNYPYEGDMRMIRPLIRSAEGAFSSLALETDAAQWAKVFWSECLAKSPCFSLLREQRSTPPVAGTTIQRVEEVYQLLIKHAHQTRYESGIDAKHDTAFGLAFYALNIVRELTSVGNSTAILGRFGLRSLLDGFVTLAYLLHKNSPDFWQSHRVFGAGQAKLGSLKLEELKSEKCFADAETLTEIANEDMWEEYLSINVGHWENSNLRQEAVEAGVKAEYDKFYPWTSSFIHGHWGAVRESVFDTCGNPLHRLHRIPRTECKVLPDVVPDACELVDKTLDLVSRLYPTFAHRVTIRT